MTELDSRTSKPMSIEELRLRTKLGEVSREDLLAEIERLRAALQAIVDAPYGVALGDLERAREALGAAHETTTCQCGKCLDCLRVERRRLHRERRLHPR